MPDPAWVQIRFDVVGETQVSRQLELARSWAEDLHEPLSEMMDRIIDNVRAQFETEGTQGAHGRWQALNPDYARWKERHWPGRPILVREGGMKGAMLNKTTAVHVGAERALYEPRSNIAGFHQSGETWVGPNWGHAPLSIHHLPQRRMLDLPDAEKHELVDRVFVRWLNRRMAEARRASGDLGRGIV